MRKHNRQKPSRSNIAYFEKVMRGHSAVQSLQELSENFYEIERTGDRSPIKVLVADIYVVSEADIFEITSSYFELDCILLIGFYNRYSNLAKDRAISEKVGLFNMREFFGAVHYNGEKLTKYEPKKKNNR